MKFLSHFFTWWNDYTLGTWWYTLRKGEKVGEDDQGNAYYREKGGRRRWVIYKGDVEASRVPPEWHAWLHRTVAETPVEAPPQVKPWEAEHQPNLTGQAGAYFPPGSLTQSGTREKATGDYEAWKPE